MNIKAIITIQPTPNSFRALSLGILECSILRNESTSSNYQSLKSLISLTFQELAFPSFWHSKKELIEASLLAVKAYSSGYIFKDWFSCHLSCHNLTRLPSPILNCSKFTNLSQSMLILLHKLPWVLPTCFDFLSFSNIPAFKLCNGFFFSFFLLFL